MHRLEYLFTVWVCLISLGLADTLAFTQWPSRIYPGQSATVNWVGGDPSAPATISLLKGAADNLYHIQVLTTDAWGGTFTFVPDTSLANGSDYAFQITQHGRENYSGMLALGTPDDTPSPTTQDTNKHDANDTSPHDGLHSTIAKGNNATVNPGGIPRPPGTNLTHVTNGLTAEIQTGDASFQNPWLGWILSAAGVIFYLTK